MSKLKEGLTWLAYVIFIEVFFLYIGFTKGIVTVTGIFELSIILMSAFWWVVLVVYLISRRIFFKEAHERELKAEDDILLQATAFSQAALWIYLTLIPANEWTFLFKVLVPSTAVLFYVIRAYGKLKEDSKYRYYSIFVFSFVIFFSVFVLMMTVFVPLWKGILLIDGVDIALEVVGIALLAPILSSILIFQKKIRARYGLS